jgi:hypothetical protein
MLTIGNFVGLPSLTLRAGFVHSDWESDPSTPPRRLIHRAPCLNGG